MSVTDWLFPAGSFRVPSAPFVGVHHGAGTSTWATLLDGTDHELVMPDDGVVTAVCRATPAGLGAAKALVGQYGVDRFRAFLDNVSPEDFGRGA